MGTAGGGPQWQESTTCRENSKTCATDFDDVDAPELNSYQNAGGGGADGLAGDSLDSPTTGLGKRRRPDLGLHYESEILKRRCSTVLGGLQEAVKAAEDWNTILCAHLDFNMLREEELLAQIDAQKKKEARLLEERGELIYKIALQNEKEELLLQGQKKLIYDIEVRKKTKTLLIQERKELIEEISRRKGRETLLQEYRELESTFRESEARGRKRRALFLQARKELLKKKDVWERTETVLLREQRDNIYCMSKRIHVHKKKELQLFQELKDGKVKLRKAVDKLRIQRDTVSDRAINMLRDVTQKVLAFTADLEESQLVDKFGCKTANPRAKSCRKTPRQSLPSGWEDAKDMMNRAEAAFSEAAKNWKRAQEGVEVMKSRCRQGLLDRVLGRKERAAPETKETTPRDILNEGQPMMKRPKMEHIMTESEERGRSSSPSSEPVRVPRKRKKTQRYGTSPSPLRKQIMTEPRKRKKPQRYGASPSPPCELIPREPPEREMP